MIKFTQRILTGAALALVLPEVALAQENSPKPPAASPAGVVALVDDVVARRQSSRTFARRRRGWWSPPGDTQGSRPTGLPVRAVPASQLATVACRCSLFHARPAARRSGVQSPGWFGGVELQVLKPHVASGLSDTVKNSPQRNSGTSTNVALPTASLGWTVSPRVFLGYRLPSGFGEFMIAYRYLGTTGSESVPASGGPAALKSQLAFDIIDFDYNSREISLSPQWDMKWTIGIRSLFMFYGSQYNQPFGQASAGNGIFAARDYNNFFGVGPHAALEVARHLGDSGWSLYLRGDLGSVYGGSHLGYLTQSTTFNGDGRPLYGQTTHFGTQDSPMINFRAGVTGAAIASKYHSLLRGLSVSAILGP